MNDMGPDVGEHEGRATARGHPLILLGTPSLGFPLDHFACTAFQPSPGSNSVMRGASLLVCGPRSF